jgi:ribosomal protein S18 acetylase RimI-like enzyme/catechol 2,3-dioxygenase-like lactoylglutathione lyase family enzyme
MQFKHSVPILYSENVRRSIDYYTQVLQFDSKWEWSDPPTFGGVSKELVQLFFCEKGQGNPGTWLAIMVKNVDDYYQHIKANGAIIRSAPDDKEWGLREMLVEDPDGHILRIGHPISHMREESSDLPETIVIIERKPTVEEYQQLVAAVGWKVKDSVIAQKSLEAPLFSAVAEDSSTNKFVGCVLLLGDGASFYYVKDMMVHPEWQQKRVGTALMQKLNEWIEGNAAPDSLVGLYTGENLAPFYRQFGFSEAFGMCRRIRG